MRPTAFLIRRTSNLHAPPIVGSRLVQSTRSHRRRLDDQLAAIFHRACASNNLDTAADLLTVLEKWHARRLTKYGRERRVADREIEAMRVELRRLTSVRLS
jgi:hypothetical protein